LSKPILSRRKGQTTGRMYRPWSSRGSPRCDLAADTFVGHVSGISYTSACASPKYHDELWQRRWQLARMSVRALRDSDLPMQIFDLPLWTFVLLQRIWRIIILVYGMRFFLAKQNIKWLVLSNSFRTFRIRTWSVHEN